MVEVDVSLTVKDVVALQRHLKQGPLRPVVRRAMAASVVMGILVVVGAISSGGFGAILIGVGLMLWGVACRGLQQSQLRAVADTLSGHVVADGTGMTITRPGLTTHAEWGAFVAIERTPDHLFLRLSSVSAYILPRGCFSDATDGDRLYDLATAVRS